MPDTPAARDSMAVRSFAPGALWRPEPGLCGSLLNPDQDLVPSWLAEAIDGHLRPLTHGIIAPAVRIACEHIDWELAWLTDPALFWRGHTQASTAPEPQYLWQASSIAVQAGFSLILDVHIEPVAIPAGRARDSQVQAAVVVHGAGVEGELPDPAWSEITQALTTCGSTLYEPRHEQSGSLRGGPPPIPRAPVVGTRPLAHAVLPERRLVGDWPHTWWSYPHFGARKNGCQCPAHQEQGPSASEFGPRCGSR